MEVIKIIKIQIGGSPCTYWSIAQTQNRETEASGMGWDLFENYLIAKEKFKPNFFLYENNWSADPKIKNQISNKLQVPLHRINSALVSAQNRDRFYCHNWDATDPTDRGILLIDILDTKQNHGEYELKPLSEKEMECMFRKTKNGKNHWDYHYYHNALNAKSGCLLANTYRGVPYNVLIDPVRVGTIKNKLKNPKHNSKQYRVYSPYGKSTTLCGNGGGVGAKTGLYMIPVSKKVDCKTYVIHNGLVLVDGIYQPIDLPDGEYIIRKLNVPEACRLQTLPDNYCDAVSYTQALKGLGNGWTAEIIIHLLQECLNGVHRNEKIVVLSMYDGIGTGRYCLDKMGFKNVEYHAYEIDKYAIQIAMSNYPDIIQHGDAFQVRNRDWTL